MVFICETVQPHISVNWYVTVTSTGLAHMYIITSGRTSTSKEKTDLAVYHCRLKNRHGQSHGKPGLYKHIDRAPFWGLFRAHSMPHSMPQTMPQSLLSTHRHSLYYHM